MRASARFRRKGERREPVGNEIDPEGYESAGSGRQAEKRREEYQGNLADVRRDIELDELSDIIVNLPPLTNRSDDGRKLSSSRTIWADSFATSVPVMPMAMPISARFSAGASFTPSPVMATYCPAACSALTIRSFCSGATRAYTLISGTLLLKTRSGISARSAPVST